MEFSEINKKLEAKKHTMLHYVRRIIFSGVWLSVVLILLQFLILLDIFVKVGQHSPYIMEALTVLGVLVMIYIINEKSNPAYKIAWIIPIMIFPLIGSMLYLFVRLNFGTLAPKSILNKILKDTKKYAITEETIKEALKKEETSVQKLVSYIENEGGYPVWNNTQMEYFSIGDDALEPIIEELKKAKEYIFLEYYIIEEGIFWNQILEVLEEKAKQGLEVRVMYDDFGCVALLPRKYHMLLKKKGIKVKKYAKLTPFLSTHLNNRDHRKMIIIDGKTAFSGGINLADEYINAYEKYGHWKDNGFLIRGDAVHNYTLMFLQMWHSVSVERKEDYEKYLTRSCLTDHSRNLKTNENMEEIIKITGYVIPYGDGPHQIENVAEQVYIDIINRAKNYLYIMTPYLILDYEMQQDLMHAAKCGVDVRIIMPHIPDKKTVFYIGRTYYPHLIRAGVKIYEYTPGFIHSKTFLSDDELAVVGTINLDFRSLYLHYECGTLFYKNAGIQSIKEDFETTFAKCQQITLEDYYKLPIIQKAIGRVLRVFGPLM